MGKKSGSGIRIGDCNNADHLSASLETIFWVKILLFFDADSGSRIWDPESGSGMEKIGPGSGIKIPDIRNTGNKFLFLLFYFR
jgi:hypothetical protein